jgi:predicted GNAT family acetyltransferase
MTPPDEEAEADISVSRSAADDRYEIHVDGALAGFAHFTPTDGVLVFDHTEIDDAYEGQGLGGRLAREAIDDVRARGERIIAQCPFIKGWIEKHPDHADVLADRST